MKKKSNKKELQQNESQIKGSDGTICGSLFKTCDTRNNGTLRNNLLLDALNMHNRTKV